MLRTNLTKLLLPLMVLGLSGCGLTQSVTDGAKSAVSAVFYKKIKVLHLDFVGREALNTDARESNSSPQPLVIRVYQLRDRKAFDKLVYQQLLKEGETLLTGDLLASRDVVLKPGNAAILDMPMDENTAYVAVVGLFRQPDMDKGSWKRVLERNELEPDKARVLEAGSNSLTLLAEKE
ncbi:type VI secretion system lipoprotein TssJ [Erwinia sp. CPCC 100877]|nr:type VI secretion system lipoprotein TssJ [Erwinia sp. CPCC 100877]